ncbi:MAG TPA: alpha/beta hydrolase [Caulobacteraceae bacterium]|jgi:acetyl esterase/lipase|nr:alpha/beta hydrolase [Caulobacteraceae bacterium]
MSQTYAAEHMPPPPQTLSPEARNQIAMMTAALPAELPDIQVMRGFAEQMQTVLGAEQRKAHAVDVVEATLAGVPVRRITRSGGDVVRGKVLMNLHGGGFATDSGSLSENIPIAAITGIEVIAVIYRLAPEHPFPAAVDDALAVYKALLETHQPGDIAVYGTSAGGVLGPQLMMRLQKEGLPLPAALGVFSGEPDLAGIADSLNIFAGRMEAQVLIDAKRDYVGAADPRDPLLSPINGDLSGFPPTLLVSSGRDVLLSGTANLGRALIDAGVDAQLVVYDALPHAFWATMLAPECEEAFRRMSRFFTARLGV